MYRSILAFVAAAVALVAVASIAIAQDPNLNVVDNFNNGSEGWQIYDYDGGGSGNVFYPVTWQSSGGVGNSGYVWGDDSRWRIDTPETPDSILSFIIYRNWIGEGSLDLRDAEVSFYLRGDNLDLKGASVDFWVLNSNTYGHRWHLTSQPLQVNQGSWGNKQTIILRNDETLWHRSWTRSPYVPGTLNDVLGNVESYGFSFVGFSSEVLGTFAMDELEIHARTVLPQSGIFRWQTSSLGNWNVGGNWDWGSVPTTNSTAVFGSEITNTTTVVTNNSIAVKSIEFSNPNSVVISGAGSVTLSADIGQATINVLQGSHQFQTVVNLVTDTTIDVATGAALAFNNILNIGTTNLSKTGAGALQINNALITNGGTVIGLGGTISGFGTVSNDLVNSSAIVAPGTDTTTGKLTVGGDYVQSSVADLQIELGGTEADPQYDELAVNGRAILSGTLDVSLLDFPGHDFFPSIDDKFKIISAKMGITGRFASVNSDLAMLRRGLKWSVIYDTNTVNLTVVSVPEPASMLFVIICMAFQFLGRRRTSV